MYNLTLQKRKINRTNIFGHHGFKPAQICDQFLNTVPEAGSLNIFGQS
jgi:hypothetical protein